MYACDFEYDGALLSNFGFIVCSFDSGGLQTASNGSLITFNTTPLFGGKKHQLISTQYNECLEATFQICKAQCVTSGLTPAVVGTAIAGLSAVDMTGFDSSDGLDISVAELRTLMKWLNKRDFKKFKVADASYSDYYYEGSFNVSSIGIDDRIIGLELTLTTNRPFALHEPLTFSITNDSLNGEYSLDDISDEVGHIYPHMEIVIDKDGDLMIHNDMENRSTCIKNCTAGEVITMDYPIITTTSPSHKIQNDFNWHFFRIANDGYCTTNHITVSLPCTIVLTYSPVVKVGL